VVDELEPALDVGVQADEVEERMYSELAALRQK
jgi:hypothetical protein